MNLFSLGCCNEFILHHPSRCDEENPSFLPLKQLFTVSHIQRLQRFLAFLHADGRQYRNYRLWTDGTNHGTLFHLEQHLRKLFGSLDALHPPFSSNERRKSTLIANHDYLTQNQTFSHNQKYTTQNKIINVSKRFVYHMSKLGSWSFGYVKIDQHLLLEPSIDKQRNLVAHLIFPVSEDHNTPKCAHAQQWWELLFCTDLILLILGMF